MTSKIENQQEILQNMPVAFFASVMGLLGLTLAWEKAQAVLGTPEWVSYLLLTVSAIVFCTITVSYALKIIKHSQAVIAEFNHPIKMSFFPAFSIGLILMSIATLPVSAGISLLLWVIGSSLQLIFTLNVLTRWIHHPHFQIPHSTPAWFIPVVGNILVPIAGTSHGYSEVSWFFFSVGLVYWLVLKTLIFNRVIFHDPLPEKLLPTLFILIAPPAVGFISYMKLSGAELDAFARILYYTAAFLVLLLATQFSRFSKIQFFLSWWAYSFPLAAFTIATQMMYQQTESPVFQALSYLMLTVVTLVVALLVVKTTKGILTKKVFQPD